MTEFKKEFKNTHTLLIPDMLPIHFEIFRSIIENEGYKTECLKNRSVDVINAGLRNVHNDTCYPALLVIGQFIDALDSGKYDLDKVGLIITQTGGGCRASNYISLLRKVLDNKYPQVPVVSVNFSGLEKSAGFSLKLKSIVKLLYAVYYGDLLMCLYNQTLPYEKIPGESKSLLDAWQVKLQKIFKGIKCFRLKKYCKKIIKDFAKIEKNDVKKKRVGIVGEIYVKYSPLANNNLEEFLLKQDCEPVVPALMDFVMYCADSTIFNNTTYKRKSKATFFFKIAYRLMYRMQKKLNKLIEKHSKYEGFHDFEHLKKAANKYMNQGVVMGEGWLIPAEMALLVESGCPNIITTQPFGCLPNHIVAKGMMRVIKENYPNANIVAIDYDPGATRVNQENRIKLMLESAK